MFVANYNCIVRKANKDDEPLILPSAFKHGVSENDILHAWREARGPVDINYDRDLRRTCTSGRGSPARCGTR